MKILTIAFTVAIYCIACLGIGSIVEIIIFRKHKLLASSTIQVFTRFLLGQGFLANIWVFISLAGHFSPFLVICTTGVLAVIGIQLNRLLLIDLGEQISLIFHEILNETFGWKSLIIATLVIWFMWLPSWFPFWASGTRFYMALPKVISASHQLKVLPGYEEVASIGLQGEMHFAVFMTMGSPESIQFFNWITFTAGCILLLALSKIIGMNRHSQWLVLAMIFTSSAISLMSGSGKTDLFGPAFAFAALYWVFRVEDINRNQISILIGLFSGMAIMAKLNYAGNFLPALLIILLWKVFFQSNKVSFKTHFLSLAIIGISILLVVIQMPIKNQVLFNNPLAPYGMKDISNQIWYGTETIQKVYLLLPLTLTFGNYWAQIGNISPLFLMFLPLIFFIPKPRRVFESPLFILTIASLAGLFFWFIINPSNFAPRYFLACLIVLLLPIAKSADYFSTLSKTNSHLIQSITILTILYTCLSYTNYLDLTKFDLEALTSGKINCQTDPISCKIVKDVNNKLELGGRIFTNTRFRYWFRPDLIQCSATSLEIENYLALPSSELRWKYLIGRGFQTIFLENREAALPETILSDLLEIPYWLNITVIENSKYVIYFNITRGETSPQNLYKCNQIKAPSWDIQELANP